MSGLSFYSHESFTSVIRAKYSYPHCSLHRFRPVLSYKYLRTTVHMVYIHSMYCIYNISTCHYFCVLHAVTQNTQSRPSSITTLALMILNLDILELYTCILLLLIIKLSSLMYSSVVCLNNYPITM